MANHRIDDESVVKFRILQNRWRLVGEGDVVLCEVEQKLLSEARGFTPSAHGKKVEYSSSDGTVIAGFDGKWIEFEREVPENLRTLVIASPVAFDLLDGA
ncbi:hypothetical protein ACFHW2_06685 [Actinomadura sp. LOL_016]|uniref:hypothetical protein n=1 Tax=unclassified Actinomadura TaxID=2626254 RepID=UPI003A803644